MSKRLLVTGSSGLIGSEACLFFGREGFLVHGLENNQRAAFFGADGDTRWNQKRLSGALPSFIHHELDIRDRAGVLDLVARVRPDVIIHTASQPSHDHAAAIAFDDFDINATGTLNLLEAARQFCPEAPFIHLSTNKVYGDRPNALPLRELATRWEFATPADAHGIAEDFPIDQSKHSLFGVSKLAADVLVQEYGRYFNMPTCCLRGGCLTGPNHAGVELHGFLSYLVKCNLEGREYQVYGFKGKQLRDNIHAADVINFIHAFVQAPRVAEVYNIGGGHENACSVLEAFALAEKISGQSMHHTYIEENRSGDHICYYSDLRKAKAHYPAWKITRSLEQIVTEIVRSWCKRLA